MPLDAGVLFHPLPFTSPSPLQSLPTEMSWEYDLLYPYWQLYDMNATVDALHADAHPWAERQPRAFFRGATTGGEFKKHNWRKLSRPRLVRACQHHAHLCDAGLTNYVQIHAGVEDEMRVELGSWKKTPMDECSKWVLSRLSSGRVSRSALGSPAPTPPPPPTYHPTNRPGTSTT